MLYGKTFIQTLEDYNEAKTIFKTIYDNFTIIEKALEVQGFKSTKITSLEWKEWQESLPELVFLLYLWYKELEEYDNAILLMEDWLVRSPTDLEATKLLDEIKKLRPKNSLSIPQNVKPNALLEYYKNQDKINRKAARYPDASIEELLKDL